MMHQDLKELKGCIGDVKARGKRKISFQRMWRLGEVAAGGQHIGRTGAKAPWLLSNSKVK